ncbi:uncharacterized protein LOC128249378 isoform X2 [Octopus bimaculoides]|uniref:uncharacterized protein LOC128249378 isoform X2 n=1 Tax=Octopus bimaculoides TaxID=37653 RepID=UPI0022E637DA|nr:uncharacterized protein LOC128249378 isoform X2 [Octopus bimaculoides]
MYTHEVIVHQNFVDSTNKDVHTQNMENMWIRVKENYDVNLERQTIYSCRIYTNSYEGILCQKTKKDFRSLFGGYSVTIFE